MYIKYLLKNYKNSKLVIEQMPFGISVKALLPL